MDMRYVCPKDVQKMLLGQARSIYWPKDVKKMLVQQAWSVYWKNWAAKHEYEELNEGIRLEPSLARASSGSAAKEEKGRVDGHASQYRQKIGAGRRLSLEKALRHWLVK